MALWSLVPSLLEKCSQRDGLLNVDVPQPLIQGCPNLPSIGVLVSIPCIFTRPNELLIGEKISLKKAVILPKLICFFLYDGLGHPYLPLLGMFRMCGILFGIWGIVTSCLAMGRFHILGALGWIDFEIFCIDFISMGHCDG